MSHALLSPSSSERWLICGPSARLEEKLPESTSSYADEGTLAHIVGAFWLQYSHGLINKSEKTREDINAQRHEHFHPEMFHHVKTYVDICNSVFEKHESRKGGAYAMIEQQFNISKWVPESFGTSDFSVVAHKVLEVVDLKYGQGVPVSAQHNTQLMLYALGVYNVAKWLCDIETVNLTIVQPRIDNTNSWSITVSELLQWAETELKPKAERAFNGKGEFVPGDHCRFCKAKPTCRALANYRQEIAHLDFELPELLDNAEIAEVLSKADVYINWLNSVKDYALQQALKGSSFPGYKIVHGRSNRVISDHIKVSALLQRKGYSDTDYLTPAKLKGVGDLEKLLGKAKFEQLLSRYVVKPKGAPALVRITDKRPGINSTEQAVEDFKHLNFTDNG